MAAKVGNFVVWITFVGIHAKNNSAKFVSGSGRNIVRRKWYIIQWKHNGPSSEPLLTQGWGWFRQVLEMSAGGCQKLML